MDKHQTILFVCTGNTCRSSMAEAITKQKLKEAKIDPDRIRVISAGTGAFDGSPAAPNAVDVLKEKGIDLTCHRSKRINPQMLKDVDYIFTMTVIQKQQVLFIHPEGSEKTFTLKEFAFSSPQSDLNIADPYGGDQDCYRKCAVQLEEVITKVIEKVLEG
ncbi:MAG: low molecular weight protein arginine phosphatase [Dehalobacterium sp.]